MILRRRSGSSEDEEGRLSDCREIKRTRKRKRVTPTSCRSTSIPVSPPIAVLLVAAMTMLTYGTSSVVGWSRLLPTTIGTTTPSRRAALLGLLAFQRAESMMTRQSTTSRTRVLQSQRRQGAVRTSRRNRWHTQHVAPREVAKFAFAEMSSSSSPSPLAARPLMSVATPADTMGIRALATFDIRCPVTGLVVCERVIDLDTPEGRCIGYAVPTDLSESEVDESDDNVVERPDVHRSDSNEDVPHSLASVAALRSPRHWIREYLHPHEIEYGMDQKSGIVRTSFLLGRLALRQALETVAILDSEQDSSATTFSTVTFRDMSPPLADCVLLKDVYGRPTIPLGFLGSVSHKKNVAVALVARDMAHLDDWNPIPHPSSSHEEALRPTRGIGVDLEAAAPRNKMSIARKVLTPEEIDGLGRVPGLDVEEEVLLRFSIKESLYKAMHPLICQYVGFQEATVQPRAGGDVVTALNLRSRAHERFGEVTSHWTRLGGYFLSTSSVSHPVEPKGGIE